MTEYKLVRKNPKDLSLSPYNVRKIEPKRRLSQMMMSIRSYNGIFEPIIINHKNQVVAGQRRWLAALEAGIPEIVCLQREFTDKEEIYLSWLENELQEPVDSRDRSKAVKELLELGETYEEIELKSGIPKSSLHNLVLITEVPEPVRVTEEDEEKAKEVKKEIQSTLESFSHRRKELIHRAKNISTVQKWDLKTWLDFVQWAEKCPLHDLEQRIKELRDGMKVDLEEAKRTVEKKEEYVFYTARPRKEHYKACIRRCKKQNLDFHKVNSALLGMFGNYLIDLEEGYY